MRVLLWLLCLCVALTHRGAFGLITHDNCSGHSLAELLDTYELPPSFPTSNVIDALEQAGIADACILLMMEKEDLKEIDALSFGDRVVLWKKISEAIEPVNMEIVSASPTPDALGLTTGPIEDAVPMNHIRVFDYLMVTPSGRAYTFNLYVGEECILKANKWCDSVSSGSKVWASACMEEICEEHEKELARKARLWVEDRSGHIISVLTAPEQELLTPPVELVMVLTHDIDVHSFLDPEEDLSGHVGAVASGVDPRFDPSDIDVNDTSFIPLPHRRQDPVTVDLTVFLREDDDVEECARSYCYAFQSIVDEALDDLFSHRRDNAVKSGAKVYRGSRGGSPDDLLDMHDCMKSVRQLRADRSEDIMYNRQAWWSMYREGQLGELIRHQRRQWIRWQHPESVRMRDDVEFVKGLYATVTRTDQPLRLVVEIEGQDEEFVHDPTETVEVSVYRFCHQQFDLPFSQCDEQLLPAIIAHLEQESP